MLIVEPTKAKHLEYIYAYTTLIFNIHVSDSQIFWKETGKQFLPKKQKQNIISI